MFKKFLKSLVGSQDGEQKVTASKRATFTAIMFAVYTAMYMGVGILAVGAFKLFEAGPLYVTVGFDFLLFALMYILSDIFSEALGYKATRLTGLVAMLSSIFVFGTLYLVNTFAPAAYTTMEGVAGGTSIWGWLPANTLIMTVGGSLIFMLGDWINDITHHLMHKRHTKKKAKGYAPYLERTLVSTIWGRLFDLIVFTLLIAVPLMATGMIDWGWGAVTSGQFWLSALVGNCIFALLVQVVTELLLSYPAYRLTKWIKKKLQKVDEEAAGVALVLETSTTEVESVSETSAEEVIVVKEDKDTEQEETK